MKLWEMRQVEKGYLTWSEYMEAVEEDREAPLKAQPKAAREGGEGNGRKG